MSHYNTTLVIVVAAHKTCSEHPLEEADVGVRAYSERGKPIGPEFSSVEKALNYLRR